MGYCEDSALALLGMRLDLNPAIGRKGRVSSGLIIAVIALCVLWAYGCASKIPRQTTEHHVYVAERTRVGEAMVTVEDVTFREGKRRACLFWGGAQFKETSSSAFREGLFYEGMSGNTIEMSHREYRRDLDNPSWVTPMKHDLSTSPVFWFLDFRVKVIEATSEAIRFVEIGRPMHHGTPQKGPSAVNIDARVNDRSLPVKFLLAAGSYKIQPVGILGGGEYNGWKSHAQGATWFNRYCVESDEFYFCEGTSRGFSSDIMAFESARSRIFALRETQYVHFYIATDAHVDNAGGVSLRLEPASAPDILVFELIGVELVADAGPDVSILMAHQEGTVIRGKVSDSDGNTLSCRWLDGEDELSPWTVAEESGECLLHLRSVPEYPVGDHVLVLEVSDGHFTSSDEMVLTVKP
jgi:hypothetical protein